MEYVFRGEVEWGRVDVLHSSVPGVDQWTGVVELAEAHLGGDLHR
ncbi:hypothetical protein [Myceligenerans indicum]|nr:hypothetical protein [Myceligenerans indicum]